MKYANEIRLRNSRMSVYSIAGVYTSKGLRNEMQQGPGLGAVSMDVLFGLTQTSTMHNEKTQQDSLRQG